MGEKVKKAMANMLHIRRTWKDDPEKIKEPESIKKLIAFNTKFIEMATDCSTVFNFRKDLIQHLLKLYFGKIVCEK